MEDKRVFETEDEFIYARRLNKGYIVKFYDKNYFATEMEYVTTHLISIDDAVAIAYELFMARPFKSSGAQVVEPAIFLSRIRTN